MSMSNSRPDHLKDLEAAKEAVVETFAELVQAMNRPALNHFLLEIFEINGLKKIKLLQDLAETPDDDIGSFKLRVVHALRKELMDETTLELIASNVERILRTDPKMRDTLLE